MQDNSRHGYIERCIYLFSENQHRELNKILPKDVIALRNIVAFIEVDHFYFGYDGKRFIDYIKDTLIPNLESVKREKSEIMSGRIKFFTILCTTWGLVLSAMHFFL